VTHRTTAIIAILSLLTFVAACASPGQSESISASEATPMATPSTSPTDAATPTPSPTRTPEPPLAAMSLVRALADRIAVRTEPSAAAALIGDEVRPNRIQAGEHLLILDGPVSADGFDWYEVGLETDPRFHQLPIPVGWVAGGPASDPWLEVVSSECQKPRIDRLIAMSPISRIGCHPDPIEFAAFGATVRPDAGLGGACLPGDAPDWLVCDNINYSFVNPDGGTSWGFLLHFDPKVGLDPTGLTPARTPAPHWAIRGHFNDKAAADCMTDEDPTSLEARSQWLTCAARFVVETMDPVD
jgi:hypothetical protein